MNLSSCACRDFINEKGLFLGSGYTYLSLYNDKRTRTLSTEFFLTHLMQTTGPFGVPTPKLPVLLDQFAFRKFRLHTYW
jgi:hypothetical protein